MILRILSGFGNRLDGCFGGNILRAYKNKEKLKTEINKTFEKYILEFDSVPEALKNAQRN